MDFAEPDHLAHAPVMEAVVVFRFSKSLSEADVSAYAQKLSQRYSSKSDLFEGEVNLGDMPSVQRKLVGTRLVDNQQRHVVQITRSYWSFAELEPYSSWDTFSALAQELWNLGMAGGSSNFSINKAELRYVNKILIPKKHAVADSLATYPHVADRLPQVIRNSFMRIELEIPEPRGVLTILQAQLPPETEDDLPFIIDHALAFDVQSETVQEAWDLLLAARKLKNEYFFNSIEKSLIERYKQ